MSPCIADLRLRSKNQVLAILIFLHGDNNVSFVEWDKDESLETVGLRFKAVRDFNRKVSQRKGLASRKSDLWSKRKFGIQFYIAGQNGLAGTAIEHAVYSPSKIDECEILQDAWDASQIVFGGQDYAILVGNAVGQAAMPKLPAADLTELAETIDNVPEKVGAKVQATTKRNAARKTVTA